MKFRLFVFILILPFNLFAFSSIVSYESKNSDQDFHSKITYAALRPLKFSQISFRYIMGGNLAHDYFKKKVNMAKLHCDRNRGVTHLQAAKECKNKATSLIKFTIAFAKKGNAPTALYYFGNALHIYQDFMSHSNYIDLDKNEQKKALSYMLGESEKNSKLLKLTGWDHRTKKGEKAGVLKGDAYAHDLFSKDSPTRNKESALILKSYGKITKHQAAYKEAVELTEHLALKIKKALKKSHWKKFKRMGHL